MNRSVKKQIASENENLSFLNNIPNLISLRDKSQQRTITFTPEKKFTVAHSAPSTCIEVCLDDVINICQKVKHDNAVVLNFASAYNPGGGYLKGSTAQEEVLCRASTLYNCLKDSSSYLQKKSTNGLYVDNVIYSPDVPFFRDENGDILDELYTMGVISMAAPNAKQARFKNVPENVIEATMNNRINRILEIAKHYNHDTIILGAWGCGVFGNDPNVVAKLFKDALKHYSFKKVYFAIHDERTYDVFNWIFRK